LPAGHFVKPESCGFHGQADAAHAGNSVAVADLQDQPLFEDFLEYLTALVQRKLVRPDSIKAGDLPETRIV
jgi:hypothetical protein